MKDIGRKGWRWIALGLLIALLMILVLNVNSKDSPCSKAVELIVPNLIAAIFTTLAFDLAVIARLEEGVIRLSPFIHEYDRSAFAGMWHGAMKDIKCTDEGVKYGPVRYDFSFSLTATEDGALRGQGSAKPTVKDNQSLSPLPVRLTGWPDAKGRLLLVFYREDGADLGAGIFIPRGDDVLLGTFSTISLPELSKFDFSRKNNAELADDVAINDATNESLALLHVKLSRVDTP